MFNAMGNNRNSCAGLQHVNAGANFTPERISIVAPFHLFVNIMAILLLLAIVKVEHILIHDLSII